jgi:hypothetical protein
VGLLKDQARANHVGERWIPMYRAEMGGLLAGKTERERAAGCRGAGSRAEYEETT